MSAAGGGLLEMRGIVKRFPGARALDGVDLEVRPGEVHCLLGQNGAGKSTLIKVLSGAERPDAGTIVWQGNAVSLHSPTDAMKLGIATIYQELDLVDGLSVAENIFLGHEKATAGFTRRAEATRAATELLERLGHGEIPPTREVWRMSAAGKQLVSMARALSHDARLIIMDEPSAALAHNEVANLFRVIRNLVSAGVAVIYISHRLGEIREIGDRMTILEDGRVTAAGLPARTTPTSEIVNHMTGRSGDQVFPARPENARLSAASDILRVEQLCREGEFADVTFNVREGEIIGIAGLVGSGRSEILETIFGARKSHAGQVSIDGRVLPPGNISAAVDAGIGLAPEERKSQALLLHEPVFSNITLSSLTRFSRYGLLDGGREISDAAKVVRKLDVRPADPRRLVRTLSGGNQQKTVLARWLLEKCRVLLLDEPTRGVDVGARFELYTLIRQLADTGVSVVLVSSELPEVLGMADRVVVLREGGVVDVLAADAVAEADVLDLVMEGAHVE